MPEGDAAWLWVAVGCALAGMGWLALALPVHALPAWGGVPSYLPPRRLRAAGSAALRAPGWGCGMPEGDAAWLWVAVGCALAGMGWLALALPAHALQAWGGVPSYLQRRRLRAAGGAALLLSLAACLAADHATMAVLV